MHAALRRDHRLDHVLQLGLARAGDDEVLRLRIDLQRIHVHAADRLAERIDRVLGIEFGTEQAGFLGRDGEEHLRALRRARRCLLASARATSAATPEALSTAPLQMSSPLTASQRPR